MALQFYFGSSGSGKSHRLHRDIITWAEKEPGRSFLFLVPDQFTMQTQLDLVNASKKKGIMNIDVLSFGRLAHRIFEETGFTTETVLDDTGKESDPQEDRRKAQGKFKRDRKESEQDRLYP